MKALRERLKLPMLWLVALNAAAVTTMSAQTSSSDGKWLDDPVFGVPVDVRQTHYEPMPARVARMCSGFPHGKFWVFASYREGATQYLIVSGFIPDADSDPIGNVVALNGKHCTGETVDWLAASVVPAEGYGPDSSKALLPGKGAPSKCNDQGDCRYTLRSAREEALVRGLARDALARGAKAWGEKAFHDQVCDAKIREANAKSSQIFSEELEKYCSKK